MNEEEIIKELKKLSEKLNNSIRINQDIRTILMALMISLMFFVFIIFTAFPDPVIACFIVIIPMIIGFFIVLRRKGWV